MEVHPVQRAHGDGQGELEDMEDREGEIARRHPKDAHFREARLDLFFSRRSFCWVLAGDLGSGAID